MHFRLIGSLRLLNGRFKQPLLQTIDFMVLTCSALLAPSVFAGEANASLWAAALAAALGVGLLQLNGVYKAIVSESDPIHDGWRYVIAGTCVGAYELFVGDSLRVAILAALATAALLLSVRLAARRTANAESETGRRTAIYGAGKAGIQLAAALDRSSEINICLFVDDNEKLWPRSIAGRKIIPPEQLAAEIKAAGITDMIVAIPSLNIEARKALIGRIRMLPVRISIAPDLREILAGQALTSYRPLRIDELLGREPVAPIPELIEGSVTGECVLVTGAGGSIGSELCRQISARGPRKMVLLDASEHALYEIDRELRRLRPDLEIVTILGNVTEPSLIDRLMVKDHVSVIFHAAAYKHVPLVESNVVECIRNNVFGTLNLVMQAEQYSTLRKFVLISTDKAVRPTNVMGASKRICELILQARAAARTANGPIYSIVRFGNVLGSSGSVVPLFQEQIDQGGPVTLTHPDVTRYFMSIPEAAQLVLQAATLSDNGDLFVLDMGAPIRIADLARSIIHMRGFVEADLECTESQGIKIRITGLRPGEKLYEELLLCENAAPTAHPKIMRAREEFFDWAVLADGLGELFDAIHLADVERIRGVLGTFVSGYASHHAVN